MKKKNILNLIKYHSENNEVAFRDEAYEIARYFDLNGDYQLAEYIMSLLSQTNTFIPQTNDEEYVFFEKIKKSSEMLLLPEAITQDIIGIVNAIGHRIGINKFLFEGAPGTGKTEAVKQIARILDREIFMINFESIIDSKLGQTQKNIVSLFNEINSFSNPDKIIILFDEIDALALDRTNSNDLREMGRATSTVLKGLDSIDDHIILIATTNLYSHFDKALKRRFDAIINFNRYTKDDLIDISVSILNQFLQKIKINDKDIRLFKKIINLMDPIPYPGELKNLIKISVAFSDINDSFDYLRRLYINVCNENPDNLIKLKKQGFTVREIEVLTKISKSQVARELKEGVLNE